MNNQIVKNKKISDSDLEENKHIEEGLYTIIKKIIKDFKTGEETEGFEFAEIVGIDHKLEIIEPEFVEFGACTKERLQTFIDNSEGHIWGGGPHGKLYLMSFQKFYECVQELEA